jgi:hypothetical protein
VAFPEVMQDCAKAELAVAEKHIAARKNRMPAS